MTDIHSHLIYGIDDGARSLEESIELIKKLSSIGFDNLIITPHYIEDSEYSASNEIKEEKLEIIRDELKKNNINVDRPIIQSSGYNGSEPVRICPNCNKPKPISEFGFRKMGNGQIRNQSWCKDCR